MQYVSRIAVKFADITVGAALANNAPANIDGVDVAILPFGDKPDATTAWVACQWAAPLATFLLIGPAAVVVDPPVYSLALPVRGGDLYGRVNDDPEVDAVYIDRIVVE